LKIALIQTYKDRYAEALPLIQEALYEHSDLVVLPEKWAPPTEENFIRSDRHPFLTEVSQLAASYSSVIITGALYEKNEAKNYITSYVYGPDGDLLGKARKIHLFGSEKQGFSAGDKLFFFNHKNIKVGVAICYDLDFPEPARIFALKGCDLLAVPAKILKEGADPWMIYVQARVLENRLPVAFANVWAPPNFCGQSAVVDMRSAENSDIILPRITKTSDREGVQCFEVNPENYRQLRSKRLSDRNEALDNLARLNGPTQ
jgi:omega-amidase